MTVLGIRFREISAKREGGNVTPQIKVNSVPKITGVSEKELPMIGKKTLSVEFDFVTEYDPKIGTIRMSGEVYYVAENSKEALKNWKSKKELPEKMRVDILNHLFRACLLKIAYLADDLQLPAPISIPRVKPK